MTSDVPNPTRSCFQTDFAKVKRRKPTRWVSIALSVGLFILATLYLNRPKAVQPAVVSDAMQTVIPLTLPQDIVSSADNVQEKTLIAAPVSQERQIIVKAGDSLSRIFHRLQLHYATLHDVLLQTPEREALHLLHPEQKITISTDAHNQLLAMRLKINPRETLVIQKNTDGHFEAKKTVHAFESITRYKRVVINDSLFSAGHHAGLTDKLIMSLAEIFAWDIDFVLDIRPGDKFSILYEEKRSNGQTVDIGPILAAEFVNQGKTYQAVRFTNAQGKTDYYGADGQNLRKAFLRTPVNFTRISSRFNRMRKHPILHRMRAHKGVDYAAPRGTPVKAAGDGKIQAIGRKGGYGKVIVLQHGQHYTTVYGHLSRFVRGLRRNATVKQGQIIGYVGSTGLATGPHLHYEFHVNGQHRDPLQVALPDAKGIATTQMPLFVALRNRMLKQLDIYTRTQLAMREE